MAQAFGHAATSRRWALGAAALTTALAVIDAAFGSSAILIGLFVLGPLLAAALSGPRETAALAVYALGLGFVGGLWNEIFLETEHFTRLLALSIGASLSVWIASLRVSRERTNDHLLAQNALAITLVESRATTSHRRRSRRSGARSGGSSARSGRSTSEARRSAWSRCGRSPASRRPASSG